MTPPNLLTILRFLLVPVFIQLVVYGYLEGALGVFLLAGFTDLMDGIIARRFNQRSQLGAWLDPLADKFLLVSGFVILSLQPLELAVKIPLWLTIAVISRDILLVTAVLAVNLALGRHLFPPSVYGKLTTTLQSLLILIVLLGNALGFQLWVTQPLFFAVLALTVFSGLHYLFRGLHLSRYKSRES